MYGNEVVFGCSSKLKVTEWVGRTVSVMSRTINFKGRVGPSTFLHFFNGLITKLFFFFCLIQAYIKWVDFEFDLLRKSLIFICLINKSTRIIYFA